MLTSTSSVATTSAMRSQGYTRDISPMKSPRVRVAFTCPSTMTLHEPDCQDVQQLHALHEVHELPPSKQDARAHQASHSQVHCVASACCQSPQPTALTLATAI